MIGRAINHIEISPMMRALQRKDLTLERVHIAAGLGDRVAFHARVGVARFVALQFGSVA